MKITKEDIGRKVINQVGEIELTNLKFQATFIENYIGSTLTNQQPEKHNATNN